MANEHVVGIVRYKDQILLGKKRSDSSKGLAEKWHIPGETIKRNETDEQALERCFDEEASIEIIAGQYINSHFNDAGEEVRWYECFYLSGDLRARSDLEDVKWVDRKQVIPICSKRAIGRWPKEVLEYFRR